MSHSVWGMRSQLASGLIGFSTTLPVIWMPAFFSRAFSAAPKNSGALSTAIGVDHQTGRAGTVPETVTLSEPADRRTATRTAPRLETVRAEENAWSTPVGGSIETAAGFARRAPGGSATTPPVGCE